MTETEKLKNYVRDVKAGVISPYVTFYDLETTGTNTKTCEVTQYAGIRTKFDPASMRFVETSNRIVTYVRPVQSIPAEVTRITGISDETVADAPEFEEIADDLYCLNAWDGVAGYNNTRFDDVIMNRYYAENGRFFLPSVSIDVMKLAKECLSSAVVANFKLGTIFEHLCPGIEKKYHDASEDITATINVVNALLAKIFVPETELVDITPTRINFWQSPYKQTMSRVYVDTNRGRFYYDCYRKSWVTPDRGSLDGLNIAKLQADLFTAAEVESMNDLIKKLKELGAAIYVKTE